MEGKSVRKRFTGGRIRRARLEVGMTQKDLGRALRLSGKDTASPDKAISEIERGSNGVDAHTLYRIAQLTGYPMEFFVNPNFEMISRAVPLGRRDWEALYPDDPERARRHWEIDHRASRANGG